MRRDGTPPESFLQDQLHRKFLLTDSLRPEALGSAVGVLLVRKTFS